jgi:hypothetical protein
MNPTHVGRYLNGTRRHLTIFDGDEEDAAEIALSASATVRQVIEWGGDE